MVFDKTGIDKRFKENVDHIQGYKKDYDYQTSWSEQVAGLTTIQEVVTSMKDRLQRSLTLRDGEYSQDELIGDLELIDNLTKQVLKDI